MNIIARYSDFDIDTINFFIDAINESLAEKDITSLTNGQVNGIPVLKEHPLVQYMASAIDPNRQSMDNFRTGMVPGIGVTPGNMDSEMETFGETPVISIIDDNYIATMKQYLSVGGQTLQNTGVLTVKQLETIMGAYKKLPSGGVMRMQTNSWGYNEEVNVSCWAESPDYDTIMSRIIDSVLAGMKVGIMGDNSFIKKMKYKVTRGLTNFNFGRVLYGSEFNLTFFNKYNNYIIYTEDSINSEILTATWKSPGGGQ